jgi:pyruvate dehydrogenase E2 component (dihydrolipoamide acetyltransferase)
MDVLMPQLGETVAEGKITQWFKAAGDPVQPGDNLFEIETDKVSMEVPSTVSGMLAEIRVPVGEVAPVGAVVAVISDGATAAKTSHPGAGEPAAPKQTQSPLLARMSGMASFAGTLSAQSSPSPVKLDPFFEVRTPQRSYGPARLTGGTTVTPLARRLAVEAGIDLSRLTGSGPRGRISARDVQSAHAAAARAPALIGAPSGLGAEAIKSIYRDVPFEETSLDAMRSTIAKRLVGAKQTIPHFYLTADVAISRLLELREAANSDAPKDADGNPVFKLSVTDLIIKAWAASLARVPDANAVWAGDRILKFKHADIGVAVAVPGGLIAPVIRRVGEKTLSAISKELKDLTARARARKLESSEYQGGSSTISNLGMYGVREFSGIINPPQASLLAIGAARRQPVEAEDGGVRFASMLSVTASCDHRVIDGALGAELLAAFKRIIEQPIAMLI